jgi:hypothetical protein
MDKKYASAAEKQRAYRARKYAEKFPELVPEGEMTDEVNPVYPELRKWSDREYDKKGLVLFTQQCPECKGTWGASIEIQCPYCKKGKGMRKAA